MSKIQVMVIDDSAFMRKVIKNLMEEYGTIEVIATARNGSDALKQLQQITPDVITLDVEMPIMNGLEFLNVLMETKKIPVVMLSSITNEGATETFRALELGAVDFIAKPSGVISLDIDKVQKELIDKVETAARLDVSKLSASGKRAIPALTKQIEHTGIRVKQIASQIMDIVAIGTSTGGPRALQEVLTKIPANFPAPILIVQHMPPGFTKSLAERLNSICEIRVTEATHRQRVEAGVAYIAPGNYHMKVDVAQEGYLQILLDQTTPPKSGHRPSVDILFESIASLEKIRKYAVIMTGMGNDGSVGLKQIKDSNREGVIGIAEDESTCIVYGMPRSAIQMGLIDYTLQLDRIADQLIELLMYRKSTNIIEEVHKWK